jgi:hypothetical protein
MKLQEICKAAEYFILGEEQCWFEHHVVIQGKSHHKAKFVLFGASGQRDIAMQSVCGRYVPIVHTTDPSYNKFDDWDIVEVFHSRKEYWEYQRKEEKQADKEENGNGMTVYLVETYAAKDDFESRDLKLYYLDPDTGLVYKELFDWDSSLRSNDQRIVQAPSRETYIDPEDGEEYYHQIVGYDGLVKSYEEDYKKSDLAKYFDCVDYKIVELGVL